MQSPAEPAAERKPREGDLWRSSGLPCATTIVLATRTRRILATYGPAKRLSNLVIRATDRVEKIMNEEKPTAAFMSAFMVASCNSAQGFLERAARAPTKEHALECLDAAEQWLRRAQAALVGELPEGLSAPSLEPRTMKAPLEPLDAD